MKRVADFDGALAPAAARPAWPEDGLLDVVAEIARTHLNWQGALSRETRLVEGLALDSLRLLTLVVELEDRFLVCLDEEDEASMQTVGDLLDTIRRKRAEPRPHAG